jgi:hypothetical protein
MVNSKSWLFDPRLMLITVFMLNLRQSGVH